MPTIALPMLHTDRAFRDAARGLLGAGVPPDAVLWQFNGNGGDLFADPPATVAPTAVTVPRAFVDLMNRVVWHSDPQRFARLYALLWRLRVTPGLMTDRGDPALAHLMRLDKDVRRDKHKMTAFVRFRDIGESADGNTRRRFAAWFEPSHCITEPTAPFFANRFGDMDWMIQTPHLTAHFESGALRFSPGAPKPPLPEDATEDLWRTYYANIFNPARLKIKAMTAEMPKKYWKNLPEAELIPGLIANAESRARAMQAAAPTLPPLRSDRIIARLPGQATPDALNGCTRCPLFANATQAVPGEGPDRAALMIVGEQPGDHEDLAGRPFVGPAGQMFDRLAQEAGLARDAVYVTNAVKHFKFTPQGKRRIHQRPDRPEIEACKWWLDGEIAAVQPRLIVAMGATAAYSLTGNGKTMTARRGTIETRRDGTPVLLTFHPSFLLRQPDATRRAADTALLRGDLALAARWLAGTA
ncbi:MAG: UdgX family uracil-DNA binding protein [Rhodobacterales bacterium]|nr:UdgX family uracil-DNA binding protein [Rhodobacterales bacterium]